MTVNTALNVTTAKGNPVPFCDLTAARVQPPSGRPGFLLSQADAGREEEGCTMHDDDWTDYTILTMPPGYVMLDVCITWEDYFDGGEVRRGQAERRTYYDPALGRFSDMRGGELRGQVLRWRIAGGER